MFVLPAEQQSVDIEFIGKCTYRKFIVFGKALVVRRRRNSSGLLSIQISVWTAEHGPNQLTKQRVQYINKTYAMLNSHGVKIKKTSLTSKVGFERAMNSREWSEVERATLQAMVIQLEAIRESQKVLDAEIVALAETLPGYRNLISIKGIEVLSAATFLAAIGDIRDFPKPGNLAAYIGIAPRVSQFNDTQFVGRITKRGNKAFRTKLVQCALIAIKYSPYLRDFYEGIKSRRGSSEAIIAVARKLLNTIFYTLRENRVFEDFPNYEFKTCN